MEEMNAIIDKASIEIEDHGILTLSITMKYGGGQIQGFGNYDVRTNLGWWMERVFATLEVNSFDKLKGKTVRVRREDRMISAIGHIIEDKWFCPKQELNKNKK